MSETETPKDTAHFDGNTLSGVRWYTWPTVHSSAPSLQLVELENPEAHYWSACNGICQAWKALETGETCIALVDDLLRDAIGHSAYVIWKPKTVTPSIVKNWVAKWSKRTRAS